MPGAVRDDPVRPVEGPRTVDLVLASNYAVEPSVLETFWRIAGACEVLVIFKGKSFDWPTVSDRSQRFLMFRQMPPLRPLHIELHILRGAVAKSFPIAGCKHWSG